MKLLNRKIKIVTVHASGSIRQLINSELRVLGYLDVVGVPDLQSVIAILETEMIHWLITPVLMEERLNVFQILKLITEDPSMMDMRVSFVLDQPIDNHMISKAFDMGLMSLHKGMLTKTVVEAELKELFDICQAHADEQSLVAATYLRRHLIEFRRYEELLRFEKALFQLHTGHARLLKHLAEAHLLNQQADAAKQLAARTLLIAPELQPEFTELFQRYESLIEDSLGPAPQGDMLGVKSCMLVEPDAAARQKIELLLKQLGIAQIRSFTDAEPALAWIKTAPKPELVIFAWQLKSVPGPVFVQRLREIIGQGLPVTVMSKELTERDMPVLRELGVTDRIKKPIEDQKFLKEVIWVIHQDRTPSEPLVLQQKIRQAMAEQDFQRLAAYTKRYMDSTKTSETEKTLMQAELAYFRNNFTSAKSLALQALKKGPPSVEILNLLGKSLMKLRDFEMALRCLENAEVVSPNNVRRICQMAEAQLERGEEKAYGELIEQAMDLDPDSQAVAEVETKSALVHGDSKKAKSLMQSLQSLINIVSFTNNRAISLIRNDRFEDGTSLYNEAIQAVPDANVEVQAVLHYNLGLALGRMNRLAEARHHLDLAADLHSEKIHSKVVSLRKRVLKAIDEQTPLELHAKSIAPGTEAVSSDPARDYDELMMALTINAGDLACHKIYFEAPHSAALKEMIERPLRFKKRTTLARPPVKAS